LTTTAADRANLTNIGSLTRLGNDALCVKWDVKPQQLNSHHRIIGSSLCDYAQSVRLPSTLCFLVISF